MLYVGQMLYGYCGGYFGDSYDDKRIEFIGGDYIVVRDTMGDPLFERFSSLRDMFLSLEKYTKKEE